MILQAFTEKKPVLPVSASRRRRRIKLLDKDILAEKARKIFINNPEAISWEEAEQLAAASLNELTASTGA